MPEINIKQNRFSCVTTYHCYVLLLWSFLCINIYVNSTFFFLMCNIIGINKENCLSLGDILEDAYFISI